MITKCSIDGCENRASARSWCMNHYMRWKRNGHPTGGGITPGDPAKWVAESLSTETDECITWPFGRNAYGYGSFYFRGKTIGAHRAVCIMVHGEPPEGNHHAMHSCGNGDDGCVNHRHIRWGTPRENANDRVIHAAQRKATLDEIQPNGYMSG